MATATSSPVTDYRHEWFDIEDATYLNLAAQSPMPKVAHRAVQTALEWKKNPHHMPDSAYFEVPNRIRASIAKLIGGKPEEIALTTGARTAQTTITPMMAVPISASLCRRKRTQRRSRNGGRGGLIDPGCCSECAGPRWRMPRPRPDWPAGRPTRSLD